jgi:hypothetical protein
MANRAKRRARRIKDAKAKAQHLRLARGWERLAKVIEKDEKAAKR